MKNPAKANLCLRLLLLTFMMIYGCSSGRDTTSKSAIHQRKDKITTQSAQEETQPAQKIIDARVVKKARPSGPSFDTEPAWSLKDQICFVRYGHLWVINADGTGEHELTVGPSDCAPTFSPDGKQVAFDRCIGPRMVPPGRRGGSQINIWIINIDGTGEKQLTHDGCSCAPSWSPDGKHIAFYKGMNLWVMNANGTHQKEVAHREAAPVFKTNWLYIPPSWSPNGKLLVTQVVGEPMKILKLNGRVVRTLPPSLEMLIGQAAFPAWSPKGDQIAFQYFVKGNIWVVSPKGQNLKPLTKSDGYTIEGSGISGGPKGPLARYPRWSPDGKKLVFVLYTHFYSPICILDLSTGKINNLTQKEVQLISIEQAKKKVRELMGKPDLQLEGTLTGRSYDLYVRRAGTTNTLWRFTVHALTGKVREFSRCTFFPDSATGKLKHEPPAKIKISQAKARKIAEEFLSRYDPRFKSEKWSLVYSRLINDYFAGKIYGFKWRQDIKGPLICVGVNPEVGQVWAFKVGEPIISSWK